VNSLVIQTSFLGDLVLTTPLLAELATRGPVDVVVTPAGAPLLANHPAVRDVIVFDKRGRDDGVLGLWRFGRTLRHRADGSSRAIDRALLAQGSLRSAAPAKRSPSEVGQDVPRTQYSDAKRPPGRHHGAPPAGGPSAPLVQARATVVLSLGVPVLRTDRRWRRRRPIAMPSSDTAAS